MNRKSIVSSLVWMMVSLLLQAALGGRAAAQISINLLDGTPKNGLSDRAFLRNALITNPAALTLLIQHKLTQELLDDPYLQLQLSEPRARAVMEEIIRCALPSTSLLTYVDDSAVTWFWPGELGLCTGSDVGNWSAAPPSAACKELVTACVMARVNGRNTSVPLSMRGAPPASFPIRGAVPVETRWRDRVGAEDPAKGMFVESFSAPLCLTGHECRWAPAYVGKCAPDQPTQLAIDSPSVCGTTPIRVCAGLHGCNKASSTTGPNPGYAAVLAERVGACRTSPVGFLCPDSGFYSVMTRPAGLSGGVPVSPTVVPVTSNAEYPASEWQVFSFLEGAFYGDLFQPERLSVSCVVEAHRRGVLSCSDGSSPGCVGGVSSCPKPPLSVPYRDVYACFAGRITNTDADAAAYFNERICAQRTASAQCFPNPPVRCGARCQWNSLGVYFQGCQGVSTDGAPPRIFRAITTMLNEPCDLILGEALCTRIRPPR